MESKIATIDGRVMTASGRSSGSGLTSRQRLDQPDHVVAERRRTGRRPSAAGPSGRSMRERGDQVAQAVQRAAGLGREAAGGDVGALGDLGLVAAAAPDQVGLERDDRIAAAQGAALDRFEQEGVGPARGRSSDRPRPGSPGRRSAGARRPAGRPAASPAAKAVELGVASLSLGHWARRRASRASAAGGVRPRASRARAGSFLAFERAAAAARAVRPWPSTSVLGHARADLLGDRARPGRRTAAWIGVDAADHDRRSATAGPEKT